MIAVSVFAEPLDDDGGAILDRLEAKHEVMPDFGGPGVRRYSKQVENPDDAVAWFAAKAAEIDTSWRRHVTFWHEL